MLKICNGIDSIVLERQSRSYVLERIRVGVLEAGTVELLREVGLGMRMDREGHPHDGSAIAWEGRPRFFIDTKKFTGKRMMAYVILPDQLRLCRRLRRLPWREPASDPVLGAANLREELPIRLARHHVGDSAVP